MVLLLVMVTLLLFLMRNERRIDRTKLSPYFMVAVVPWPPTLRES